MQSVEILGDYTSFSHAFPFTLQKKRPASYRFEHKINGKDAIFGYDGETAWWVNGMMLPWPTRMPAAQVVVTQADAEIDDPFVDLAAKGGIIVLPLGSPQPHLDLFARIAAEDRRAALAGGAA